MAHSVQGQVESEHSTEWGTVSTDSLFTIVTKHNSALKAAREFRESSQLQARTGNAPPDPEVELGYLAGFPSTIGNRLDFRVSQEFEFPTAYIQMARAKDLKTEEATMLYEITRQEILSRAKKLLIHGIYLNRLEKLLSNRLLKAEELQSHYRQLVESGEKGRLSLSQSNLQTVALKGELEQVRSDILENNEALQEVSGGLISEIEDMTFPVSELSGLSESGWKDSLQDAYEQGYAMELYSRKVELTEVERELAVSRTLPHFTAGYYSETVIDQRFKGFSLGVSLPLWGNANTVKHAKAEVLYANADRDRYQDAMKMELAQKLTHRTTLNNQVVALETALSEVDDEELLNMALEMGELSLSEYIFATEFYFQHVKKLMEYRKNLLLVETDLLRVFY